MRRAIITGICGQDGTYLYEDLMKNKYSVVGIGIKRFLSVVSEVILNINLSNTRGVFSLLKDIRPDEICHLAAYHRSSEDKLNNDLEVFRKSYDVHALSTANLLEGVYRFFKCTRLFYAASCRIFGIPKNQFKMNDDGIAVIKQEIECNGLKEKENTCSRC